MITEIKKGDKFVCVNGRPIVHTITGKVYESHADDEIYSENNFRVIVDLSDSACAETFNSEFIPYTYEAIWEQYKAAKCMGDAEPWAELLRDMDSKVGRSTKGGGNYCQSPNICKQDTCSACVDPDIQHEQFKEGLADREERGAIDSGPDWVGEVTQGMETIRKMEKITGLKLTHPSLQAKVGDHIRCVKTLHRDSGSFCEGGYNEILSISIDNYNLSNDVSVNIQELDDHFVIDNSVVRDILENTPTPDVRLPPYYNNDNGSLYKIAEQRGWNAYQFEIVKRIDRSLKKGEFRSDLEKTKSVIDLWISESGDDVNNQVEILNKKP